MDRISDAGVPVLKKLALSIKEDIVSSYRNIYKGTSLN